MTLKRVFVPVPTIPSASLGLIESCHTFIHTIWLSRLVRKPLVMVQPLPIMRFCSVNGLRIPLLSDGDSQTLDDLFRMLYRLLNLHVRLRVTQTICLGVFARISIRYYVYVLLIVSLYADSIISQVSSDMANEIHSLIEQYRLMANLMEFCKYQQTLQMIKCLQRSHRSSRFHWIFA